MARPPSSDLILLVPPIFAVDAYAMHKTQVMLTTLDGEIAYEATSE